MSTEELKSSVRLPKTSFSMKANLSVLEPSILDTWKKIDLYTLIQKKNAGRNKFVLHDGPPYANGNLHVGHALNKILKDIINKSYLNMGYDVSFVIGWDCHGLPIEWKIEEQYKAKKLTKDQINPAMFRKDCRDFATKWVDIQKEEFKSLGVIADYDNPYITMDYKAESIIVKCVLALLKQGVVYQGKKPVMWSVIEQTTLAEAEVDYKDKTSETLYVSFKVDTIGDDIQNNTIWEDSKIVIWTTTPWTLPSNQALAYGKEIQYSLYQIEDIEEGSFATIGEKLIVAKEMAESFFAKSKITKYKLLDTVLGLKGFKAQHCMFDKGFDFIVPALEGDFVELGTGTGIVHIAPAHGEDDFYLCKRNNIEAKEWVLDNGVYRADVPVFSGSHIFKVTPLVIENLKECSNLLVIDPIVHSYPHSWRSKAPLIYKLTSQWFISLSHTNVRDRAIECLDNIDFYPAKGKNRLKSMLETRPDWCISRQRAWGVPLGIFLHKETKQPLIDDEVFCNIVAAFEKEGADAWFVENPVRFLTEKYNKEDYIAINDVVDVWLDSGLTNQFVLKERDDLCTPADLYLEGSDQHRGWFQSSLIMSLLIDNQAPYKKVLTHGYVLNDQQQKMSKSSSSGNITPQEVIKNFGADILRLWVASSDCTDDVSISKGILIQQTETYRKTRNILRYLIANLVDYQQAQAYSKLDTLDQWVLHNIYVLDSEFENTFKNNLNIHGFFNKVFQFIQGDLSSFYFDIKKDTLYCDSSNSDKFLNTLTVLEMIFQYLIKWLSPTLTFTAEEAFSTRYNKSLGELFLHDFDKASDNKNWYNEGVLKQIEEIKTIRKVVNSALEKFREEKIIGSSLEAQVDIFLSDNLLATVKDIDLAEICIVSSVSIVNLNTVKDIDSLFRHPDVADVALSLCKAIGQKCDRCWKFKEIVHDYKDESHVCDRCLSCLNTKDKE